MMSIAFWKEKFNSMALNEGRKTVKKWLRNALDGENI